ncbi:hypothetical protein [Bacillus horti]|uniref:Uncharacterized protein n=1 Tax=Caldalkalibacillus horti TaxID=77523 RepID=A0ABT9W5I1_9BACI|nr:hypothetical protein [Bacillus horti]MDQ0168491.1 hypothetical protein [Bacillus horti]
MKKKLFKVLVTFSIVSMVFVGVSTSALASGNASPTPYSIPVEMAKF